MINAVSVGRHRTARRGDGVARSGGECAPGQPQNDGLPRALPAAGPARRTLARRLLLVVRARVEKALAALDARGNDGMYDGDLMALQRGVPFSLFESDTRLFRSWNRGTTLPAPPFVEVIPLRQSIESTYAEQSASRAPLDASGWDEGSACEQAISRAQLARAHEQFLDSLPPRERALFAAGPRADRH
jgi:hypothetical protein